MENSSKSCKTRNTRNFPPPLSSLKLVGYHKINVMNKGQIICVRPKSTRLNNHSTQHTPLQQDVIQSRDLLNTLPTESHRNP